MAFITVAYDPKSDLTINVTKDLSEEMTIETDELALTYIPDYAADGVFFNLTDKFTGESKTLGFDIRYWQSQQEGRTQPSGVYIFRPKDG